MRNIRTPILHPCTLTLSVNQHPALQWALSHLVDKLTLRRCWCDVILAFANILQFYVTTSRLRSIVTKFLQPFSRIGRNLSFFYKIRQILQNSKLPRHFHVSLTHCSRVQTEVWSVGTLSSTAFVAITNQELARTFRASTPVHLRPGHHRQAKTKNKQKKKQVILLLHLLSPDYHRLLRVPASFLFSTVSYPFILICI